MIVKPVYLYEDKALYKKIQDKKQVMKDSVDIKDIREQFNNYDTYTEKAHLVITENNNRALRN